MRSRSQKSYLTYFIPPLWNAMEHFRNAIRNVANFLRQRLYQDFGMKELIERFYNSIRLGGPVPIPHGETVLTAPIMDQIFAQIYPAADPEAMTHTTQPRMLPHNAHCTRRGSSH